MEKATINLKFTKIAFMQLSFYMKRGIFVP